MCICPTVQKSNKDGHSECSRQIIPNAELANGFCLLAGSQQLFVASSNSTWSRTLRPHTEVQAKKTLTCH